MSISINNTTMTFNDGSTQTTKDNITYGSGSAGYYPARAFVAFNAGSGTPSITNNYNVSSIGDNGVGLFTINFSTAMPAANFAWMGQGQANNNRCLSVAGRTGVTSQTTSTLLISTQNTVTNAGGDFDYCSVAIYR